MKFPIGAFVVENSEIAKITSSDVINGREVYTITYFDVRPDRLIDEPLVESGLCQVDVDQIAPLKDPIMILRCQMTELFWQKSELERQATDLAYRCDQLKAALVFLGSTLARAEACGK